MLPAVLLLCGWWRRGTLTRKDLLRSVPFFALSLALGLVTVWFQHHNAVAGAPVRPGGRRLAHRRRRVDRMVHLYKLLLPAGLCVIYPRWNVNGSSVLAFLPLALLVAGMAWLWMRRKSWGRAPLFALAYFALPLLPVLGFVDMAFMQYSLVADHLQYLAMIGPVAFAAAIIARAAASSRSPGWAAVPVGGCVVALGILTWGRGALYGDEARLWKTTSPKTPAPGRLGTTWASCGRARAARTRPSPASTRRSSCAARAYAYTTTTAAWPSPAWAGTSKLCATSRAPSRSTGLRRGLHQPLRRVCRARPVSRGARRLRAGDAIETGRCQAVHRSRAIRAAEGRYDLALADYDRALALDAEDGETWHSRGLAHAALKRFDLAIGDYDRAIRLNPGFVEAHYYRGRADLEMKQFADAVRDYSAVIALNPNSAEAYKNRAIAWALTGRRDEAERDLTQAIALKPDYALAYYTRAQLYSEMKKYAEALADIGIFEKLGGHPDPDFVKSLTEAARRAE